MGWLDTTSDRWFALIREHPEVLAIECDIMSAGTVAKVLQHIVAVELRYAQRLNETPASSYEDIPFGTADELASTHNRAMELLKRLLADKDFDWEQSIEFQTRSAGVLRATRRTVLAHSMLHSVRHYAQLATLLRQNNIKPNWPMDYIFMGAAHVA